MNTYTARQLIQMAQNALINHNNETTLTFVGSLLLNSKIEYLGSSVYESENGELFVDVELEDNLTSQLNALTDQTLLEKTFNAIAKALNLPKISAQGSDSFCFV